MTSMNEHGSRELVASTKHYTKITVNEGRERIGQIWYCGWKGEKSQAKCVAKTLYAH
jgi:hypothetical protein